MVSPTRSHLRRFCLAAAIACLALLAACAASSGSADPGADVDSSSDGGDVSDTSETDTAPDVPDGTNDVPDVSGDTDASPDVAPDADDPDVAEVDVDEDVGEPEDTAPDVFEDATVDSGEDTGPPPREDGLVPLDPPPAPTPPSPAEIITITVTTASSTNAGTDDGVRACVSADTCAVVDVADINDRELGQTDVYHLRGLGVSRDSVDRLTLESTVTDGDNDRWTPICVEMRVDGVPVYCNDRIPVHIGTGGSANEVSSWTDPEGLHEACRTCWDGGITHGPLLGPATDDAVRVSLRADATRLTGLRMGSEPDLSDGVMVAWAWPRAQDDFTTDLVVSGLQAGHTYYWRVEVDGDITEPVRSVRTAPGPGTPEPLRLSIGSCSRNIDQPIFDSISAGDPDLFLFVGDNNYANSRDLDSLRWRYRQFRNVPERAELVANVPVVATWDDHDFVQNNSNGMCLGREQALTAFREYWANPTHGVDEAPGAYTHITWGAVDLFVVDCRMYRPEIGDGGNNCDLDPDRPDIPRTDGPLGPVQEQWLIDGLRDSDATFNLVACGSRISSEGSLDSWRSFPEARDRLLAAIDEHDVGGVVFIAGDIHRSLFATVPAPAYDIPELVSSPLANSNSGCSGSATLTRDCYDSGNSYVEVDIDPTLADPTLTARILDQDGRERATWTILRSTLE